jgi:hypothetical protein
MPPCELVFAYSASEALRESSARGYAKTSGGLKEPMRLARISEAFGHPDSRFELKSDVFRALAHVGGRRRHVSPASGTSLKSWPERSEHPGGGWTRALRLAALAQDAPFPSAACRDKTVTGQAAGFP